jgi:hypothetical protein
VRAEVKAERSARAARAALHGFPGTRGPAKTKRNESSVLQSRCPKETG